MSFLRQRYTSHEVMEAEISALLRRSVEQLSSEAHPLHSFPKVVIHVKSASE